MKVQESLKLTAGKKTFNFGDIRVETLLVKIKGTLMHYWKSANIFAFIWKYYLKDFTLKHLLLSEICAREIYEKFVYKHSETIEYVKN